MSEVSHEYLYLSPEHIDLLRQIHDSGQRQENQLAQFSGMLPLLTSINSNIGQLVDLTKRQDDRQDGLIKNIIGAKAHVPFWLVILIVITLAAFICVLLVERTGTNIKFNWKEGFEITHAAVETSTTTTVKPLDPHTTEPKT